MLSRRRVPIFPEVSYPVRQDEDECEHEHVDVQIITRYAGEQIHQYARVDARDHVRQHST